MMDAIDRLFLNRRTEHERAAAEKGGTNHDIFEKRLTNPTIGMWPQFRLTPHSMYFYYVRINRDGRLVIDHYLYVDGDPGNPKTWKVIEYNEKTLTETIKKLAINARPKEEGEVRDPQPIGRGDFKNTKWKHKSYIVIFFDEKYWTLRKKYDTGQSAVNFLIDKEKDSQPNHSFFDAMDIPVTMPIKNPRRGGPTTDTRSAILFVNHMKVDEAGNDLSDAIDQKFVFEIILDVQYATGDPPTVIIIDPGGENGGPTVPPPP